MTIPQAGSTHGHAVMTGSGAIVTSGMFGSVQQFVVDPRTSEGETDVFVEKRTAAGELMWRTVFGSPEYDEEIGLAVDHADNSFVLVRSPTGLSLTKLAP